MTTQTFDPAALQVKIAAITSAYQAREDARAAKAAASKALDDAEVAYQDAKSAAIDEVATQAGLGAFQL